MPVARQGGIDAPLFHDDEARAIREGEFFVLPVKEPLQRALRSPGIDPLPGEARASLDLFPPAFGGAEAETHAQQSQRLVHHVVGGKEDATSLHPIVASLACLVMTG